MISKLKYLIAGIVIGVVVSGVSFADDGIFNLYKMNCKITLNGIEKQISEPVLNYNGKSYVPLRAFGDVSNVGISWDSSTSTINLTPRIEVRTVEKQIIKEVPKEVIKEVIKEVPKEVIKEVPVEKIIYVPQQTNSALYNNSTNNNQQKNIQLYQVEKTRLDIAYNSSVTTINESYEQSVAKVKAILIGRGMDDSTVLTSKIDELTKIKNRALKEGLDNYNNSIKTLKILYNITE